jgi:hypothetical protein
MARVLALPLILTSPDFRPFRRTRASLPALNAVSSQVPFGGGSVLKGIHTRGGIIMKANRFVVIGVVLSVAMSAAALALQVQKTTSPGIMERYENTCSWTQAEKNSVYVRLNWLQSAVDRDSAIQMPIWGVTEDGKAFRIRIPVWEKGLPTDFEKRRQDFELRAAQAQFAFEQQFTGLPKWSVLVEFFGLGSAIETEGKNPRILAVYKDRKLTMY